MKAIAKRNIKISKGDRIIKGQEVTILRAISTTKVKLAKIIFNNTSFITTLSIAKAYFQEI